MIWVVDCTASAEAKRGVIVVPGDFCELIKRHDSLLSHDILRRTRSLSSVGRSVGTVSAHISLAPYDNSTANKAAGHENLTQRSTLACWHLCVLRS